jgi:hypothetical protein
MSAGKGSRRRQENFSQVQKNWEEIDWSEPGKLEKVKKRLQAGVKEAERKFYWVSRNFTKSEFEAHVPEDLKPLFARCHSCGAASCQADTYCPICHATDEDE